MKKLLDAYIKFYPLSGVSVHRRVAIHIAFWLIWGVVEHLSSISNLPFLNKMITSIFVLIQNVTIYYGFTYFAFPKLISKDWWLGVILVFVVYAIYSLESYAYYSIGLKSKFIIEKSFQYSYAQNYIKNGILGILRNQNFFFEIYMVISNSILPFLVKFSRVVSQYYIKVEKISKEKAELEVDFLRAQINPHFFLNALNNIYSQIITKDEAAADSVILLSDLMKYILYNSNIAEIELEKEIRFLRSFVDLEKLKESRNVKIKFSEEGDFSDYRIAPLILVNYLENAFKHGGNSFEEIFLIDIEIRLKNETLYFKIENDYLEHENKSLKESGIGIENTRKRLELLYPKKHSLKVSKDNKKFLVEVEIQLDKFNALSK
jgi:two-component system, LytTR family, sensor kinase